MSLGKDERLRELFESAYRRFHRHDEPNFERDLHDFSFHMLDAKEDFVEYAALLEHPEEYSPVEAARIVDGMLNHAVNHLVAAARLHFEFGDPFRNRAGE